MKIIVLGANGGIGSQVVMQGLDAGHDVTAVARRPESVTVKHERLTVVRGDAQDAASIAPLIAGQDVVVSSLGVGKNEPTTLYSQGVTNMMNSMQAANVSRILCISASGLNPGPLWQRIIAKPLLWYFLKHMYTDLARMEAAVKASALDWTIVRPPRLTDKPRTGVYQIATNKHLSHGMLLSRADTADYIVRHLKDAASYRAIVEIAY
jgi:putative NADH-flavin reductase